MVEADSSAPIKTEVKRGSGNTHYQKSWDDFCPLWACDGALVAHVVKAVVVQHA